MKARNLLGPKGRILAAALAGIALVVSLAELVLDELTGGVAASGEASSMSGEVNPRPC